MCVCRLLLFSRSVMSDYLQRHGLKPTRFPCPSVSPRVCSSSCPLHWWCHTTISSCHSLSPSAFNLSQHQCLFQWVSCSHQAAKVLELQLQLLYFINYAFKIIYIYFIYTAEILCATAHLFQTLHSAYHIDSLKSAPGVSILLESTNTINQSLIYCCTDCLPEVSTLWPFSYFCTVQRMDFYIFLIVGNTHTHTKQPGNRDHKWPTMPKGFSNGSVGKESTCKAGDTVATGSIPGSEKSLGVTHSSILACRIPWTEEPGRLQSKGSQRIKHDWATKHTQCLKYLLPGSLKKYAHPRSRLEKVIKKRYFNVIILTPWVASSV